MSDETQKPNETQPPKEATVPAPGPELQEPTVTAEATPSVEAAATKPAPTSEETSLPPKPEEKLDRLPPNEHAEMSADTSSPLTEKNKKPFDAYEKINLLCVPVEEFNTAIDAIPNLDLTNSEEGQHWLESVQQAQIFLMRGGAFEKALGRDTGLWRQGVKHGTDDLKAGRPRFGENPDPANLLTGERAVLKLSSVMGLGAIVQIPLWHTGIWISLKAPSEAELLELDRRIALEKIALGRLTSGLVFSNSSVYTNSYVINLALSRVYDATIKDISLQSLKDTIKLTDLPTLIWGLACTIWPNGYPYEQACVANPANCQYVMSELLNLTKLSWTDNRALTEYQQNHMTNRNSKITPEQLKRYQEEHDFNKKRVFTLHDDAVSVELKVPTLSEYELSGFSWVEGIVNRTDEAFSTPMSDTERNEYIVNQGKATAMRQYGHWIDRLVLANDGGIIADRSTIEQVINALSADGQVQTEFFDNVGKFIDNTTISMIAVPRYECPKCHKDTRPDSQAHPHLVPLDVGSLFFTLLGLRSYKVRQRSVM